MNRVKAQEILKAYGRPTFKVGNTNLTFSRQTEENLAEIEAYTEVELVTQWKSLVWMNEIYGQVSLNELQRLSLLELEMSEREIPFDELQEWYAQEVAKFYEEEINGGQE